MSRVVPSGDAGFVPLEWCAALAKEGGMHSYCSYVTDDASEGVTGPFGSQYAESEVESCCASEEDDRKDHYYYILSRPPRFNLEEDKKRIRGYKQERWNSQLARFQQTVSRQDHHIMLRILIGQAYFKDPKHRENRKKWCKVLSSMSNKFDGAAAILSWSPDPYADVIGALSRMRLWSDSQRKWDFNTPVEQRTAEVKVLELLRKSKKLFLDEIES